jgi:hypothetical protein
VLRTAGDCAPVPAVRVHAAAIDATESATTTIRRAVSFIGDFYTLMMRTVP